MEAIELEQIGQAKRLLRKAVVAKNTHTIEGLVESRRLTEEAEKLLSLDYELAY